MRRVDTKQADAACDAFTLVELLVVISVVVLLISMLLPALRSARETAQRSVCSSQLRQIHLGVQVYAGDHDDAMPPSYGGSWAYRLTRAKGPTTHGFGSGIADYVSDPRVFACPTSDGEPRRTGVAFVYDGWGPLTYTMDMRLSTMGDPITGDSWYVPTIGDVTQPSRTPMIWDGQAHQDAMTPIVPIPNGRTFGFYGGERGVYRHGGPWSDRDIGAINLVFVDGHGESPQYQMVKASGPSVDERGPYDMRSFQNRSQTVELE